MLKEKQLEKQLDKKKIVLSFMSIYALESEIKRKGFHIIPKFMISLTELYLSEIEWLKEFGKTENEYIKTIKEDNKEIVYFKNKFIIEFICKGFEELGYIVDYDLWNNPKKYMFSSQESHRPLKIYKAIPGIIKNKLLNMVETIGHLNTINFYDVEKISIEEKIHMNVISSFLVENNIVYLD